jgi:hypothetical protein
MLAGNTPLPVGFTSIATITAAGGEGSVTFSSIPATYTDLQIRAIDRDTNTGTNDGGLFIQFNGDTASTYPSHEMYGNGTSVTAAGNILNNRISSTGGGSKAGQLSANFGVSIWDIADYTNTSKYKTVKGVYGNDYNASATNVYVGMVSGLWMSTAAINSITIAASVTFAAGSTFALYGIKGAA